MRRLHASVVRVGFLPNRVFGEEGRPGANLSALGDGEAERAPFLRPVWVRASADEMELVLRERALAPAANLPCLDGDVAPVTAHEGEFVAGFEAMYRLLAAHRDALCAPGGPIEAFAAVEVRHVIRATQTYGRILEDVLHPDHQRVGGHEDPQRSDRCAAQEIGPQKTDPLESDRRKMATAPAWI